MKTNEILRLLRKNKGYSQQKVANMLGISRPAYVMYETGVTKPFRRLNALAKIYGVSVDCILGNEDFPPDISIDLEKYLKSRVEVPACEINNSDLKFADVNKETLGYSVGVNNVADKYNNKCIFFECKDNSMKDISILKGDILVVHPQSSVENGDLAVMQVNDTEIFLRRVRIFDEGVVLEPANPEYPTKLLVGKKLKKFEVIGKVLEIRRKF